MHPQQQQQRRPFAQRQNAPRQPRPEPPSLEEIAGVAARSIIRDTAIADTVENWRELQHAAFEALSSITTPEQG